MYLSRTDKNTKIQQALSSLNSKPGPMIEYTLSTSKLQGMNKRPTKSRLSASNKQHISLGLIQVDSVANLKHNLNEIKLGSNP